MAALAILSACGTSSSTAVTPTNPSSRCGVTVAAQPAMLGAAGGSGTVVVSTDRECAWEAASDSPWLALASASGQGDGVIPYTAAANALVSDRRAGVVVNGRRVEISQGAAACVFTLDRPRQSIGAAGGALEVRVVAQAGCAWTARSDAPWLSLTSATTGQGSGSVTVSVAPNATAEARTASVTIAGQVHVVEQAALGGPAPPGGVPDPNCTFVVTPSQASFTAAGGAGELSIAASAPSCTWSAATVAPWITIQGPAGGTGTGRLGYVVTAHAGGTLRSAFIQVAGTPVTIDQAGVNQPPPPVPPPAPAPCTYTVRPTQIASPAGGGTVEVAVTASAPTCSWTSLSDASWISVQGAAGATGSGVVRMAVQPNAATSVRNATVTVAGTLVAVTQAAASPPPPPTNCTFELSPSAASFASGAGTGETRVVASAATCAWTAVARDAWITIGSGGAGTGSGTVTFAVAANAGTAPRTGAITIAGLTFTVTQAAAEPVPCTFAIAPTSVSLAAGGGPGQVTVTASRAGCAWTAASQDSWITLQTNGGTNSGPLTFTVAANAGSARTGTVVIAGQTLTVSQAGQSGELVQVNGRITAVAGTCPAVTFTISGTTIVANASTTYRSNESCSELRAGRNAHVQGRAQPDGTVVAVRVENISGGGGDGLSPVP